jgi:FKBP-type peptidyl-prolyl cis-trans isomerase
MSSGMKMLVILGALALLGGVGAAVLSGELSKGGAAVAPANSPGDDKQDEKKKEEKVIETASGLKYVDLKEGLGDAAKAGDSVAVHYTGWLTNGKKFDSSHDRKQPFTFDLGKGQVIKGWDEGVVGMKVGGKRKLMIPHKLGYGDRGFGDLIPPKSDLVFEVDLLRLRPAK